MTDDAGLFVEVLGDEPGIYTARYADDEIALDPKLPKYQCVVKLLRNLKDKLNRSATYRCAVTCMLPNGTYFQELGESKGRIAEEITGELKRPYFYSVFILDGYTKVFNDLTAEELKIILGGAEIRDESIVAISKGKDMSEGMPLFFEVTATEINFAIRECIDEIAKAITEVLEVTPPELIKDITDDGIFLCGGVSGMYGLDKFIEKQTGIKVKTPGRETEIAALGCLRTICEEKYLEQNGYHFVTLETLGV